jgi:outer membrane protein TolC
MRLRVRIIMLMVFLPVVAHATSPASLDELLAVSLAHYPKIQEAKAKRDASEAAVTQAMGAFDASLDNTTTARVSGYYGGNYTSNKLVKPLGDYNAKIAAGYRVSDGRFPIYEDYNYTNRGGEFNIELFFSLLRDRDIDDRRLNLWNSKLQQTKAEQELLLSKLSTQREAMIAYYEWIAAAQILSIQEELLDLTKQRQKALKQKYAHGDIAAVTVTENEQYLFRREGQLNDAKRLYQNTAINLSLYWRDAEGKPIVPEAMSGKAFSAHDTEALTLAAEAETLYRLRPELKVIEAEIAAEQNELKAGENSLLPKADIMLRTAKDIGSGSYTREETEHVVGLNVSIPLQQRLGEGRTAKAKAKLRSLEQQQRLVRDKIAQQLHYLENDLAAAERNIEWSSKEVQVASKMQSSEAKLFASGGSDYFLLNMREEQRANAKIKNVSATLDYYRALADAYAAAMKLEKLKISSGA